MEEVLRSKSMNLGERVKKVRKSLGLSQKEFASRVPGKMDYYGLSSYSFS
ncbi:unnamed protein product [marine sediment metagenome]|uniref:HTH cro/C1-type domain-containing protein n=1 Tax=marine sediment metagenome TaxID=412755 RepID=X1TRA8_9ZZZZ